MTSLKIVHRLLILILSVSRNSNYHCLLGTLQYYFSPDQELSIGDVMIAGKVEALSGWERT